MLSFLRLQGHVGLILSNGNIFTVYWHHMLNVVWSLIYQIVPKTGLQHALASEILRQFYLRKLLRIFELQLLLLLTNGCHGRLEVFNLIFELNISILETVTNDVNASKVIPGSFLFLQQGALFGCYHLLHPAHDITMSHSALVDDILLYLRQVILAQIPQMHRLWLLNCRRLPPAMKNLRLQDLVPFLLWQYSLQNTCRYTVILESIVVSKLGFAQGAPSVAADQTLMTWIEQIPSVKR